MAAKHPDIRVTLNSAGDDFRIIDHVIKALRRAGIPAEEIETFCERIGINDTIWIRALRPRSCAGRVASTADCKGIRFLLLKPATLSTEAL